MDLAAGGEGGLRGGREAAPMPAKFRVEHGATLKVHWRWFAPHFVFLVLFCGFWDGFLVVWYTIVFTTDAPIIMAIFPLLHVAVGCGLTWYTICGFVNSTTIDAGGGRLVIQHGPLPWPGSRVIDTAKLEQLYCEEKVSRGKNGNVSRSYELHAIDVDGISHKLLGGLTQPAHALWLEQTLESQLGLTDRPVADELAARV